MALETIAGWVLPTSKTLPGHVSVSHMEDPPVPRAVWKVALVAVLFGLAETVHMWGEQWPYVAATFSTMTYAFAAIPAYALNAAELLPLSKYWWFLWVSYPMLAEYVAYAIHAWMPRIQSRYPTLAAYVALSSAPIRITHSLCASFLLITLPVAIFHIILHILLSSAPVISHPRGDIRDIGLYVFLAIASRILLPEGGYLIPWRATPPPPLKEK